MLKEGVKLTLSFDDLDKSKRYCVKCFNEGVIKELKIDLKEPDRFEICDKHNFRFRMYVWCKECSRWTNRSGNLANSDCLGCLARDREFNLKCKVCDKRFKAKTSNINYCSDECFWETRKDLTCSWCGKTFKNRRVTEENFNPDRKYFCTMGCSSSYTGNHPTEEHRIKRAENAKKQIKKAQEYWRTPEGRKRKAEICAATNKTELRRQQVRDQWKNEDFYNMMSNSVKRRWKEGVYGTLHLDNLEKLNTTMDEFCEDCGEITPHNGFHTCLKCHPRTNGQKSNFTTINNVKFYKDKPLIQLVNDILSGKEDIANYPGFEIRNNRVTYNRIDVLTDEKILLNTSNFHEENNVKMYKDKILEVLVDDILSGKEDIANYPGFSVRYNRVCYHGRDVLTDEFLPINSYFTTIGGKLYYKQEPIEEIVDGLLDGTKSYTDYPNFSNRFGRICYKTIDVLTEEVIKLDGSLFTTHNNVLHIQDFNGEYVPAEYFFNQQEERMNSTEISELTELLISTEGFTREPIICDLEGETWSRAKTDKYLCDKGYGWIVYVKLLDGKPFIVGKTGTKLVSASQIDFDFLVGDSKDERYCGVGRSLVRHMYPNRETTDFDSILVKAFEDENEALIYEQYIANTYQLFQS